jgi:hypothetical protein
MTETQRDLLRKISRIEREEEQLQKAESWGALELAVRREERATEQLLATLEPAAREKYYEIGANEGLRHMAGRAPAPSTHRQLASVMGLIIHRCTECGHTYDPMPAVGPMSQVCAKPGCNGRLVVV